LTNETPTMITKH